MKNKIIKTFGIILFTQVFLYACCANDEYNIFITSVSLTTLDGTGNNPVTVNNENFRLLLIGDFETELITSLSKKSGFLNTANAITCLEDYNVVNPITNINLEANVPLFDVPAGESLNDHVLASSMFNANTNSFININDLVSIFNDDRDSVTNAFLKFDTAIPAETSVIFKITFTLENDEQLQSTATEVTFE